MTYTILNTDWGAFGFVANGTKLVATFLPANENTVRRLIDERFPDAVEAKGHLPRFRKQALAYFAGKPVKFDVDVDLSSQTPFRQKVLKACRRIPHGKTASYADLARTAGSSAAVRAAGGAMANNPLPLVIPCHRVLRSDGSIGGFSSPEGVKQKKRMLRLENVYI